MRFRMKRAFTTLLISNILMLVLPSVYTVYLQKQVLHQVEKSCVENTQAILLRAGTELTAILSEMDNAAMQFVFDTNMLNTMYMHKPLDGDNNVYRILTFNNILDEKLNHINYGSSGYRVIMRDNGFVFYNGAVTYGLSFYYQTSLNYASMDFDHWLGTVFGSQERFLMPMDTITFNKNYVQNAVTYVYPIVRRMPGQRNIMAVVQFFLAENMLHGLFSGIEESGKIVLMSDHKVIAQLGNTQLLTGNMEYPSGGTGFDYIASGSHGRSMMIYRTMEENIQLIAVLPADVALADANAVRNIAAIALAFYFLAESVLCILLARHNARPIRRFVTDMKNLLPKARNASRNTSEYAYLEQGISIIVENQELTDNAMTEKQALERMIFLDRLLDNDYKNTEELEKASETLEVSLKAGCYTVAAVAGANQETVLKTAASLPLPEGICMLTHIYHDNMPVLLFLCGENAMQSNLDRITGWLHRLLDSLPGTARAGLGKFYGNIVDLPNSCQQAVFCVQVEEAREGVNLFDIVSRTFCAPHFTVKQQQKLTNATKRHDEGMIDEVFDQILVENTQERHLSSALKTVLLANVESTLLTVAEEMITGRNLSDLLHAVRRGSDFRERLHALREAFKEISRADESKPVSRNVLMKSRFDTYIHQLYADSGMCVASAAEHFGFSESHFSMIFKELLGEPFSVYLENLRLQKAAELMRGCDMSIEEVAVSVGYSNSTTFRRAFKRKNGISPMQYKEAERKRSESL